MTSTPSAAPAANGTSGSTSSPSSTHANTPGRLATRPTSTMKGLDSNRKQSNSPLDGGQRRNPSQKAWTQGTNPITQRPSYTQQNGNIPHSKYLSSPTKPMGLKETNTPDKHANDRLIFLLANCIGLPATITDKNGDKFSGIFSSSSLESNDSSFVLKMVQKVSSENGQMNGVTEHNPVYVGSGKDHAMLFDIKEILELAVDNVSSTKLPSRTQNGTTFRTDTDISGNVNTRERKLEPWQPPPDSAGAFSLEDESHLGWDQFAGTTTTYTEETYTTAIDRSDPNYARKEAEASRLAAEIERSAVTNPHLREERGLVVANDGQDEEEKYSGVRRDDTNFPPLQSGQSKKYMPPARRPQPGQPGYDPAIISATVRPDSFAKSNQLKTPTMPKQALLTDSPAKAPQAERPQTKSSTPVEQISSQSSATTRDQAALQHKTVTGATLSPRRKLGGAENATATVETDVLESFKDFANKEKLRVEQTRRDKRSQDKAVKLNDLMSFSKNFKLHTPVPVDLIPILAKDKSKQEKIVEKAEREHREHEEAAAAAAVVSAAATPKTTLNAESKAPRPSGPSRYDAGNGPPPGPPERPNFDRQSYRGRQGHIPTEPQGNRGGRMDRAMQHNATMPAGRNNSDLLSVRLMGLRQQQQQQQQQQQGGKNAPLNIPAPIALPDGRGPQIGPMMDHSGVSSPQRSSAIHTPTSTISTKFNVKALEFKPNPAANSFTPAGTSNVSSSPRSNTHTRSVSRAPSPSAFFGAKKPVPASERPSILNDFNPIKRMKKEVKEAKANPAEGVVVYDYAANGGIPPPYKTPPVWDVSKDNEDKTYSQMYDESVQPPQPLSPQARPTSNPPLGPQHQLPVHLQHSGQHIPPGPAPHQPPHHIHPQQPPYPAAHHFDDPHRMHVSASSSSYLPSPRMQQNAMAYSSPMGGHAQVVYGGPSGQVYMPQGGPQQGHLRPYPAGAQFAGHQNAHMAAPMMVQQPSNGPYTAIPPGVAVPPGYAQMPMYSPSPNHSFPQQVGPAQPHSGYPSPGRGAPMMMHQGSQQGHHPQNIMFMPPGQHGQAMYASPQPSHVPMRGGYPPQPPQFSSSPLQPHHFPAQPHRLPSNSYGNHMQHMPPMPHHMPSQQPPAGPPMQLASEGVEEVK